MRFDGILTSWDAPTASGIITPGKGGNDIAVHASALPQDGQLPRVGEPLSFEVESGPDGAKRACACRRPRPPSGQAGKLQQARASSSLLTGALLVAAASAAVLYAAMLHNGAAPPPEPVAVQDAAPAASVGRSDPVAQARFARQGSSACDGRTRCSQMNSCAEAKHFLDNCPGTEMDGDADGIPCESQWCTPGHTSDQAAR